MCMDKILFSLALGLALLQAGAALGQTARSEASARKQVWQYLQRYNPDAYQLVKAYYDAPKKYQLGNITVTLGPRTDFMVYVYDYTDKGIRDALGTVVHEINHGYTSVVANQQLAKESDLDYEWGDEYSYFFLNNQQSILVKHTQVYTTRQMHPTVPKNLHTFRYDTYVYPSDRIGAQVQGAYGLLDELNAYYQGTRTSVSLYPVYEQQAKNNPKAWLQYFSNVSGTSYAHMEFRFYILHYLLYAKDNYPEVYKGIMGNAAFLKAFTEVDTRFDELNQQYLAQKRQILNTLNTKGTYTEEDDQFVYIGGNGVGHFGQPYNLLKAAMQAPKYQAMYKALTQ